MAIDIRNINEITFTQSFRGYNTDEVDDFLDELYDEAIANNKEIDELKKKLVALEANSGGAPASSEDTYNVIADAQQEADKIIENARQKAHSLIESAEAMHAKAPAHIAATSSISSDATNKLKELFDEMYQKQMAILNTVEVKEDVVEKEVDIAEEIITKKEEIKREAPSVSFAGISSNTTKRIPAERDILGEINSIDLDGFNASEAPTAVYEPIRTTSEEIVSSIELVTDDVQEENEDDGLAFSFADPVAKPIEEEKPNSFSSSAHEDPDDIIAQILRDNNRN